MMFSLAIAAPGSLTGYGFICGLLPDFSMAYDFNNTEDIGCLDAPSKVAAGGMRSGGEMAIQLFSDRGAS